MQYKANNIRPIIEILEDRELPGNLLSALLAGDFFGIRRSIALQKNLEKVSTHADMALGVGLSSTVDYSLAETYRSGGSRREPQASTTSERTPNPISDFRSESKLLTSLGSLMERISDRSEDLAHARQPDDLPVLSAFVSLIATQTIPSDSDTATPVQGWVTSDVSEDIDGQFPVFLPQAVIEDPGEPPPASSTKIDVPINANDDNGSPIVEYIPQKYDYQATKADYPPNTNDPDLVLLPMVPEIAGPNPVTNELTINYTLTLTQPQVAGHLKIWDTQAKDHEYTVFGQETTQNLLVYPNRLNPGYYQAPKFYLEGTEPSLLDDDISITLGVKSLINGVATTTNYQLIKATVTPRIDTFKVENGATYFGYVPNPNYGNPGEAAAVPGPNSKSGYFGYAEFKARFIGALGSGIPHFLLNVTSGIDTLGIGFLDKYFIDMGNKVQLHVFSPTTAGFPLLDTESDSVKNSYGIPYYPPSPFFREWVPSLNSFRPTKNGIDPQNNRAFDRQAVDQPGATPPAPPDPGVGSNWEQIGYSEQFKLWIVIAYEKNGQRSLYPLASITWQVSFSADTYVFPEGMTHAGGSVTPDPTYTISHAKPNATIPPLVNGTWIANTIAH